MYQIRLLSSKKYGELVVLSISSVEYQCDNFGYKQCLQQTAIWGRECREWVIAV